MTQKRTFKSVGQFLQEMLFLVKHSSQIRSVMHSSELSPAFRERLMLAVTSVNQCRLCSYHHAQVALQEGIGREDSEKMLQGCVDHCPSAEVPAILYAQHWADTDGKPEPAVTQKITEQYGKRVFAEIDLILHLIRMGNYMGNAVDPFLKPFTHS